MNEVKCIENAYLIIEDGIITDFGPMCNCPSNCHSENPHLACHSEEPEGRRENLINAKGGFVMPTFCDSHTHIVYAGCRDGEFRDKIAGLSYEEIAARGGGILNSADLLHNTSEEELYRQSMERVNEIMAMGTGAVEIKSGYGLTVEDELKMLRVIRRIKETAPLTVKANFLGAHAVGRAYRGRQSEYVDLVCNEMLPKVAEEGLADYVDVFCDAVSLQWKKLPESLKKRPNTASVRRSTLTNWKYLAECRSESNTMLSLSITWKRLLRLR